MATTTPNAVRANIADGVEGYRFQLRKRGTALSCQFRRYQHAVRKDSFCQHIRSQSLSSPKKIYPCIVKEEICEACNSLSLRIVSILNSLGLPSDKAQTS